MRISPAAIADAMLELVQEKQYPGGSIMEFATPNNKSIVEWERSAKVEKVPVQETLKKERGVR